MWGSLQSCGPIANRPWPVSRHSWMRVCRSRIETPASQVTILERHRPALLPVVVVQPLGFVGQVIYLQAD
jgi:hypothetical protein